MYSFVCVIRDTQVSSFDNYLQEVGGGELVAANPAQNVHDVNKRGNGDEGKQAAYPSLLHEKYLHFAHLLCT